MAEASRCDGAVCVRCVGSERVSKSGVSGDALKEAAAINTSLSALGNVIHARGKAPLAFDSIRRLAACAFLFLTCLLLPSILLFVCCCCCAANKAAHVPYRSMLLARLLAHLFASIHLLLVCADSILTQLLQDSLEKNSKTLMICQVAPCEEDAGESVCSLRFAERVGKVELGKASSSAAGSSSVAASPKTPVKNL